MPKENPIVRTGRILEVLPSAQYRIETEDRCVVLATIANRARQGLRHLRVDERVAVETTPYDPERGRIISREDA